MLLLLVLGLEPELVRDPALPVLPRSSAQLLISAVDPEEPLEASCCVWKHWRGGPQGKVPATAWFALSWSTQASWRLKAGPEGWIQGRGPCRGRKRGRAAAWGGCCALWKAAAASPETI